MAEEKNRKKGVVEWFINPGIPTSVFVLYEEINLFNPLFFLVFSHS